jgi:hypothetical protein
MRPDTLDLAVAQAGGVGLAAQPVFASIHILLVDPQ